jgi:hypothetical protein
VTDELGRSRGHQVVRALAALAIVALAVVLGAMVAGSRARTWTSWRDPRIGVAGHYPAAWHRESFDDRVGLATHTGMIFSNIPHHFEYPELPEGSATSAWDLEDLPDDAVVVEVSQTIRIDIRCTRTTPFPLALENAQRAHDKPSFGAPSRLFLPACIEGRSGIGIHVHLFPSASGREIDAVERFVESIRPLEDD